MERLILMRRITGGVLISASLLLVLSIGEPAFAASNASGTLNGTLGSSATGTLSGSTGSSISGTVTGGSGGGGGGGGVSNGAPGNGAPGVVLGASTGPGSSGPGVVLGASTSTVGVPNTGLGGQAGDAWTIIVLAMLCAGVGGYLFTYRMTHPYN